MFLEVHKRLMHLCRNGTELILPSITLCVRTHLGHWLGRQDGIPFTTVQQVVEGKFAAV